MTTTEDRLEALEARVRQLEDVAAIQRLVALYGPSVDSNSIDTATQIWDPEGTYTVDPGFEGPDSTSTLAGHADIHAMLSGPTAQTQIANGGAHVMSAPLISVDTDTAVAVCYLTLVLYRNGQFLIGRQSANRWDLVRGPEGWLVTHRSTSLLDGRQTSVTLVRGVIDQMRSSGALDGTGHVDATPPVTG